MVIERHMSMYKGLHLSLKLCEVHCLKEGQKKKRFPGVLYGPLTVAAHKVSRRIRFIRIKTGGP